jgi:hypothetical protein
MRVEAALGDSVHPRRVPVNVQILQEPCDIRELG